MAKRAPIDITVSVPFLVFRKLFQRLDNAITDDDIEQAVRTPHFQEALAKDIAIVYQDSNNDADEFDVLAELMGEDAFCALRTKYDF